MVYLFKTYFDMTARAANPRNWPSFWRRAEGMQLSDALSKAESWVNQQVWGAMQLSKTRSFWWANPFGGFAVLYGTYKMWYMLYMLPKQRKTAVLVADAYGQGGQWLNPTPT